MNEPMRTTTTQAKTAEVEHAWWSVDADGRVLGRLAVPIARTLMGKHKPSYTPHIDCGDFVVVLNAEKVVLSGKKEEDKTYARYSGYPGGLKETNAATMRERKPEEIVRLAVRRMLPKTRLGRAMLAKLKVYAGSQHPHEAQDPQPLDPDAWKNLS